MSERSRVIAQSLMSDDYAERVRCFNSLSKEVLDDVWDFLSAILSDDAVKIRALSSYNQITEKGVKAREKMFKEMVNCCDPRLQELKSKVFLM